SLQPTRRAALWETLAGEPSGGLLERAADAVRGFPRTDVREDVPPLPELSPLAEVAADYRTVGLSLRAHPVGFVRPLLETLRAVPASRLADLPHGRRVKVAGLVLLRQRPGSAKGITFVTLEDETGHVNLVIRPDVWERY